MKFSFDLVSSELEKHLDKLSGQLKRVNNIQIESLKINNDIELKNANDMCREIRAVIKDIQNSFKPYKAETNKLHKLCTKKESEIVKEYKEKEKIFKDAIGEYMIKIEEERQKQLEHQKEAEELFGIAVEVKEKPNLGGSHLRENWDFEIVDEDAVPIKYGNMIIRDINTKALRDIAVNEKGTAQIPGVRFYKKKVFVSR